MKIALISARADPFIPPVDVHGGTVLMLNLIKSLSKAGHEIDIFTRLDIDSATESQERRFRAKRQEEEGGSAKKISENVSIHRLPYKSSGFEPQVWSTQLDESTSFLINLRNYLDSNKYDVIHYFHLVSVAGWYKLGNTVPYVSKSTFSPLFLSVGRKFEKLSDERIADEKKILDEISFISCQSNGEIETIKQYYNISLNKLIKVPLGVDTSLYFPKKNYEINDTTILVCPNSIKPQKKQLEVIHIVNELKVKGYKVRVMFIGNIIDETYFAEMNSLIEKCSLSALSCTPEPDRDEIINLNKDIIFVPCQEESRLADYIRLADVAVFPSTDEGFSLLNLNCMACGTLPVCSNIKEYSEYMRNGFNAVAVDIDRGYKGFIEELELLLKNKEKINLLSKQSAESAQYFSWDSLINKQLNVYAKLIGSKI